MFTKKSLKSEIKEIQKIVEMQKKAISNMEKLAKKI